MNTILSTPGKPSLEGVYETSTGRFSESVLKVAIIIIIKLCVITLYYYKAVCYNTVFLHVDT